MKAESIMIAASFIILLLIFCLMLARRDNKLLKNIRVFPLRPNDVLVLTLPGPLSSDTIGRIKEIAQRGFQHERIFVLEEGTELSVVQKSDKRICECCCCGDPERVRQLIESMKRSMR